MYLFLIVVLHVFVRGDLEEKRSFMRDWDLYMRSFTPDDTMTFVVPKQSSESIL